MTETWLPEIFRHRSVAEKLDCLPQELRKFAGENVHSRYLLNELIEEFAMYIVDRGQGTPIPGQWLLEGGQPDLERWKSRLLARLKRQAKRGCIEEDPTVFQFLNHLRSQGYHLTRFPATILESAPLPVQEDMREGVNDPVLPQAAVVEDPQSAAESAPNANTLPEAATVTSPEQESSADGVEIEARRETTPQSGTQTTLRGEFLSARSLGRMSGIHPEKHDALRTALDRFRYSNPHLKKIAWITVVEPQDSFDLETPTKMNPNSANFLYKFDHNVVQTIVRKFLA